MSTFKLSKKDAVSDTRTNIYDLHERKISYFEKEYPPETINITPRDNNPE